MTQGLASASVYRVRQFVAAITAGHLSEADRNLIETHLSPAQQALFGQMPENDQQHAVVVARKLLDWGWRDTELIQAALLHDIGKADGGLRLAHRVLIVLLRALWPAGLSWLAGADAGWRRPFYVHLHHPEIGARRAAEAGSSPRVVDLILSHQSSFESHADTNELAALQAADENS